MEAQFQHFMGLLRGPGIDGEGLQVTWFMVVWVLEVQNGMMFNNKDMQVMDIIESVKNKSGKWLRVRKRGFVYSLGRGVSISSLISKFIFKKRINMPTSKIIYFILIKKQFILLTWTIQLRMPKKWQKKNARYFFNYPKIQL